ncbi:2-(3-amino-3-carboxypropyl)histidine synthase subunit 2 isoform X2 [Prionailurus viverrinus]|nr:2-(3-amino-3-carboxypropyl)histidine synthase subunit 2 isoform X2 [Prionailurus viverrinus]
MESTFSSPAEAALQREAGAAGVLTPLADLDRVYELERVAGFVRDLECQRVALQFPDQLLGDAGAVAARLEETTGSKMFILGDTAYGSCCVDVLGAEQAGAQALVHFGPACLSPPARPLPVAFVLGQRSVHLELCAKAFEAQNPDPKAPVVLLSEPACAHALEALATLLRPRYLDLLVSSPALPLPVGSCSPEPEPLERFGRRFPLAPGRCLEEYAPQPSGGFFRPVLAPCELEAACNPAWPPSGLAPYLTHYADLLPGSPFHVPLPPPDSELWDTPDVSLITGELRPPPAWKPSNDPGCLALTLRPQLELAESSPAASFLSSRSWQGLQPRLGQTPATGAVSGRRGIAIAYEDEGGS